MTKQADTAFVALSKLFDRKQEPPASISFGRQGSIPLKFYIFGIMRLKAID
jgi:hypothetical protein